MKHVVGAGAGARPGDRRLSRGVVALVCTVAAAQAAAAVHAPARAPIVGLTLLALDVLGVVLSLRAASYSRFRCAWRLAALGRACSAISLVTVTVAYLTASAAWWWTGVALHLAMFASLGWAGLTVSLGRGHGHCRVVQLAETLIVLGGGFMPVWYLSIRPSLEHHPSGAQWLVAVGIPLGDLVLIVAVAVVPLTGLRMRLTNPLTVYAAGLAGYAVTHAAWPLTDPRFGAGTVTVPESLAVVTPCLLMTIAGALVGAAAPPVPGDRAGPAPWSVFLSHGSLVLGCAFLLTVVIRGDGRAYWSGLAAGLAVMAVGVLLRQFLIYRQGRGAVSTDPLTGLPNRRGLEAAAARRTGYSLALLNLEDFGHVNDAYGRTAGDAVLAEFAAGLQAAAGARDVVARLDADEFVVLLAGAAGRAVAVTRELVRATADRDFHPGGDPVALRARAGVVTGDAGDTLDSLLRRAGIALQQARRPGVEAVVPYDPRMVDCRAQDAALSHDLDLALGLGQLSVVYQPLVDLTSGRPVGAEALLRWQHPTRGAVSPAEFVPVAERSRAIIPIGLFVLEKACRTLTRWQRLCPGLRPYISVNLSPRQLRHPGLVADVLAVLGRTGVAATSLVLEVTESALVDAEQDVSVLETLRGHGVRIAVDDFGTGYSSLQYLTRLPVDILKVDRSFVADLDGPGRGAAIVETVIRLGRVLRLTTVAEGIETAEQAAELRRLGCDVGQGYLLGQPAPADAFLGALPPVPTVGATPG